MAEPPTEGKGKARKITVQVTEQPAPEPSEPLYPDEKTRKKKLRNAYIYIAISIALVVVSSFDIYTPGARGQGAMGLLIVGGLWLAFGIYTYIRAKE